MIAPPPPYDWKRDGSLRQAEADAKCQEALPTCPRTFALYESPPNPCANRGAACTEVISRNEGHWICACDSCVSPKDCKANEHCGTGVPACGQERLPLRCVPGPAPERVICPPPPPVLLPP